VVRAELLIGNSKPFTCSFCNPDMGSIFSAQNRAQGATANSLLSLTLAGKTAPMSTRNLIPLLSLILSIACSSPDHSAEREISYQPGKWSDDNLREIHSHKNSRNAEGLIHFLSNSEPHYRAEAAMVLGSFSDSSIVAALAEAAHDEEPEVRLMAAFALGQQRTANAGAHLIELVERDTTTVVRTEALEAMGKCATSQTAEYLLNYTPVYLFDEAGMAWGIYRLALSKQASDDHAKKMSTLLQSDYEETRLAAARFFIRYSTEKVWGGMERLLNLAATDPSAEVRMAAARALEFHDLPERADVLEALVVYDQHPGVRVNALHALKSMAGVVDHEIVWQAVFDGNPNVSVTAAQFFEERLKEGFASRVRQQITAHPYANVRTALMRALLKHQPDAELAQRIRSEIREGHEGSRQLATVLGVDPNQREFLDSLCGAEDPLLATAALQALHELQRNYPQKCPVSAELYKRILQRGDPGQLAYLGMMLRDGEPDAKQCPLNAEKIKAAMDKLQLPQELEAWIELNRAYASLTGSEALAVPEMPYYAINWELLNASGSQPVVEVHTAKGMIRLILLAEDAPATVSYFLELVADGFFEGKPFHRVVPNFVVQTGCPRGDGYGATAHLLRSEFSPLHYGPGVVGMASAGPDTESSQWFITHRTTPHLDGRYTIFAAVIEGMDVVWQLEQGDVIESVELVTGI